LRIQPITPGARPELAAHEAQIAAERGRVSPLYQVLLHSPAMAQGWEALLTAVRNRNSLEPALREMLILRIAVLNRAVYEFDAHVPHAQKAGLPQHKIDALRLPEISAEATSVFSDEERALLQLADAMTRNIEVPDALFANVRSRVNDQQLVDLLVTIAAYNMVSRFLVAAGVGHCEAERMTPTDALLLQGNAAHPSHATCSAQALQHLLPGWKAQAVWAESSGQVYIYLEPPERLLLDTAALLDHDRVCQQLLPRVAGLRVSRLEKVFDIAGAAHGQPATCHYVVEMDPETGWMPELTQWYDTEHMPGLAQVPGTVRARRYLNHDHGPLSLACYDLVAQTVLNSPPWLVVRGTPWSDRMRPRFTHTKRCMFALADRSAAA
jgi:4-carboxymuconolactone decarboxylase